MGAIIIEVKEQEDIEFWLRLAKKTGSKAKAFNNAEIEDSWLAALINRGMRTKSVSRKKVMEILDPVNEN